MVQKQDAVLITLTVVLAVLVALALTSVMLQMMASQTYVLTQSLFPALNAAGYEYWMDGGTLLGAARERTMIPHDWDGDIGMRESEFQRLKHSWEKDPRFAGMRLAYERDGLYKIRQGLGWVDIFRYDDSKPGTMMSMLSLPGVKHNCQCGTGKHSLHPSTVFPLVYLRFGNVTAKAPGKTEEYLQHWYGKNWRVSRVEGKSKLVVLMPMKNR